MSATLGGPSGQRVRRWRQAASLAGRQDKTYRIETSVYIGPAGKGSSVGQAATAAAPPPSAPPDSPEPSVKLAVQTEKSDGAGQPDQLSSPVSTAKVMVSSEPTGGDIYADGNFMGNTPSLIDLPAGSHTVRIEAKSRKLWSRTINLTAGSKITIHATLDPAQ